MNRLVIAVALVALTGCASMESYQEQSAQQVQRQVQSSLSDIQYSPIQIFEKAIEIERQIGSQSELLNIDGNTSPVVAWKLPDYGVHRFKLDSFVARTNFGNSANVFMPEVWLLDEHYAVLKKLSADRMVYDKQSMLSRESFSEEFIIDNRNKLGQKAVYLVALTTEKARQKTMMVANYDKEYAKVRGRTAPPTPDVYAAASEQGTLRLKVTPLMSYARVQREPVAAPTPDYVPAVPAVVKKEVPNQLEVTKKQLLDKVSQAIADGDVAGAMQLRGEVRATYSQLQELFQSSYGKSEDELKEIEMNYLKAGIKSEIDNEYKKLLMRELQRGNAQAALALIDQAETMMWEIDSLF